MNRQFCEAAHVKPPKVAAPGAPALPHTVKGLPVTILKRNGFNRAVRKAHRRVLIAREQRWKRLRDAAGVTVQVLAAVRLAVLKLANGCHEAVATNLIETETVVTNAWEARRMRVALRYLAHVGQVRPDEGAVYADDGELLSADAWFVVPA